jgi:hypothetical protein
MPKQRNLMERITDTLRAIAIHDIQSAHGEACPDCRPTVDTRSPAYYFHCLLLNDSEYREHVKHLKDEIRANQPEHPEFDPAYLAFCEYELWNLTRDFGEYLDPTNPRNGGSVARKQRPLSDVEKEVRFLWRNAIENLHVPPARVWDFIVNDFYDGKVPANILHVLGIEE